LRARFKDAQFFWDFDQKTPLTERVESLKHVTFHRGLGSYYWKTEQNLAVVKALIAALPKTATNGSGVTTEVIIDENSLLAATRIAKTDLTTELVKEFTELQGIIGGQYALAQGMSGVVAQPVYYQYKPASIEDAIPPTVEGQLLGLADRIQTIAAMFGINLIPSGSKDPFALRRAANAIIKILAESNLPLKLEDLLDSVDFYEPSEAAPADARAGAVGWNDPSIGYLPEFLVERLNFYLKEVRGFAHDVVAAVLQAGSDAFLDKLAAPVIPAGANDVRDAIARAEALTAARGSEDFLAVSAAFKRIKNILKQAEERGFALGSPKSVKLAAEAQQLADAAAALAPKVAALREQRKYGEALAAIATLRPTVDAFFDKVMVLDPDAQVRGAHLGLIDEVLRGFSGIADFSEIVAS
jgi:glycyl-tRNA synthetase beta chain